MSRFAKPIAIGMLLISAASAAGAQNFYYRNVTPGAVPQGNGTSPDGNPVADPNSPPPDPAQNQPVTVNLSNSAPSGRLRVNDGYVVQGSAPGLSPTAMWSLADPAVTFPTGIAFDAANAMVGGTARSTGTAAFSLTVQDAANHLAGTSAPVAFEVAPALALSGVAGTFVTRVGGRLLTPAPLPSGLKGAASFGLDVAGPAGVQVLSTGALDGVTSATYARKTVALLATDSWDNRRAAATLDIGVYPELAIPSPGDYATTAGVNYTRASGASGVQGTASYALLHGGVVENTALSACGMTFGTLDGSIVTTSATACTVTDLAIRVTDTVAAPLAALTETKTTPAFKVTVTDAVSPPASGTKPDSMVLDSGGEHLATLYNKVTNESGSLISGRYAWGITANFTAGVSADCAIVSGGTNNYAKGATNLKVSYYNGQVELGSFTIGILANAYSSYRLSSTPAKVTRVVFTDMVSNEHTISEARIGNWNGSACITP